MMNKFIKKPVSTSCKDTIRTYLRKYGCWIFTTNGNSLPWKIKWKIIGKIAQKYFPKVKTINMVCIGILNFMVGVIIVRIDHHDIIIGNKRYKGIHGLWRVLTCVEKPSDDLYTEYNIKNYSRILFDTNSNYKNNHACTRKPKSSKGDKYMNLISNTWHRRKKIYSFRIK